MGENGEAVRLKLKLKLRPSPPPPAAAALLRRRNSIATSVVVQPLPAAAAAAKPTPAHSLSFPNGTAAAPPPLDLSGHAFASYTSLKDILPAVSSPAGSPTASAAAAAAAASSSYEISIRNRLVNRAAWAYLRPMSASPGSDGPHLLRRLWLRLSACLGFVFDRIVRFFSPLRSGR
ncbi:uncharacterized protein LOC115671538 [Syzygium oleosum]|uniref:uncharacterized protein LOC115671538 n=1 Tax=Syzygium oleosum TaxID=219896 RepID=UPI0024BA17B1|nr:uncharacterized protein LOC115671538 [Syzygium oleosum]